MLIYEINLYIKIALCCLKTVKIDFFYKKKTITPHNLLFNYYVYTENQIKSNYTWF